jgi:Cu/Ag efflux protein CusF
MKRTRRLFSVLAIASASWFIATPSRADQPSPQAPTTTMAQKISATATVVTVDAQKHHLTLRGDNGDEFTVDIPESVKLDQLHEGDRLKIDYYEAIAISLKKGEAGAPPRAGETTITERKAGTLPGGMTAHRITATVEVVKVDRAHNKLTVKRPDGATDTINVTDPALQANLANLKEGDRIQATYTEAAAITVMREGTTNPPNH